MAWNKEYECMPADKLRQFQLEKLKETVDWISKKVPFYKRKWFWPVVGAAVITTVIITAGGGGSSSNQGTVSIGGHLP